MVEPRPPDRVPHAVLRGEVVQRIAGRHLAREGVDSRVASIGQEHDARLSAQFDHVASAIVLFIAPGPFVLPDDIRLVFVDREAAGDSRLLMRAHPKTIEVQRRRLVEHKRRDIAECREVLARLFVHLRRIGIGLRRQIDLRARDVQETQRIAGGQLPRLVGADDVVRHG